MFKVTAIMRFGGGGGGGGAKEKISDFWICKETNHKEKGICAGNIGTNIGTI